MYSCPASQLPIRNNLTLTYCPVWLSFEREMYFLMSRTSVFIAYRLLTLLLSVVIFIIARYWKDRETSTRAERNFSWSHRSSFVCCRHKKLNQTLASFIEAYGLVHFTPLNVFDTNTLSNVRDLADKANGYVFNSCEERNVFKLLSVATSSTASVHRGDDQCAADRPENTLFNYTMENVDWAVYSFLTWQIFHYEYTNVRSRRYS